MAFAPLFPDPETELDSIAPPAINDGRYIEYYYKDAKFNATHLMTWRELEDAYQWIRNHEREMKEKAEKLEFDYGEVIQLKDPLPGVEHGLYAFAGRLDDHFTVVEVALQDYPEEWVPTDRVHILPQWCGANFRSIGETAVMD